MSATTHGSINFSLTDETGLYTESINQELSIQVREIPSGGGETIAAAFYKHGGTFSMEGALKTSGSPSWLLASSLTLANVTSITSSVVSGYSSGAKFKILSYGVNLGAETEERRTISGNIYPFLA